MKKDILIKLNSKNGRVEISTTRLGINGENLQGNIVMEFIDEFIDGTAVLELKRNEEKYYLVMNKENNKYTLPILSSLLTETCVINFQLRITVGTGENVPVWKSNIFYLKVEDAINSTTTIPEEYESWIDIANEKLNEIDNLDLDVNKEGTASTVTITKKDGSTKSVEIKDATINGVNTLNIEAGTNITLDQIGNTLTINSTGGGSGGSSDYEELDNLPSVNNVELKGNKTLSDLGIQPAGNYALKSEIPDVSNFITNSVNNLLNYYLKSETYTKQEVNNLIGQIATLQFQVVSTLPQTGDSKYIYLVPSSNPKTQNVKDEYIWVNNFWEQIGSTQVDLTGYATEDWVNTQISEFLTQTQIQALINTALSEYTETDPTVPSYVKNITQANITSWNNKQDSISDLSTIRSGASAGATAVQPSDLATVATTGSYDDLSNTPTNVSEFTNDAGYLTTHQDISGKEDKSNKVTSISENSTDRQYPSAKCVYDMIGDVESILIRLTTGGGVS